MNDIVYYLYYTVSVLHWQNVNRSIDYLAQ